MSAHIITKEISQYICDLPDDDPERNDALKTLSLVSRDFLELLRPELFSDIVVDVPSDRYYAFFELLQSPWCKIPRTVTNVKFRGVGNAIGESSALSAFRDNMPIFLRHFREVEILQFYKYKFGPGVWESNSQLSQVRSKCAFKTLVLSECIFDSADAYVQTVARLASRSRSLRELELCDVDAHVGIDDAEESHAMKKVADSLDELPTLTHSLWRLVAQSSGTSQTSFIIPWVHRNLPMLRKLELCDLQMMMPQYWEFFLDIIAAPESLEHLTYGFAEGNFVEGFNPPVDLSSRSLTLSHLSIYRTLDSGGMAPEPDTLQTISKDSPLEVIRLKIVVFHPNDLNGIDLGRIDSILSSKRLVNLREVQIHYVAFFEEEGYVGGRNIRWEGLESVERKIKRRMSRLEKKGILQVVLDEIRDDDLVESRG